MKNRKIINIVIIVGTIIALLAGGLILYKILTPKKDPMKYDAAVELSKNIKENKETDKEKTTYGKTRKLGRKKYNLDNQTSFEI